MQNELFKVSGCGITAICQRGESMLWIIRMIVYKGGVPRIERYTPEVGPCRAD